VLLKIFIAGIDGYLGWTLAQYLAARGHTVSGVDNGSRRRWVEEIGSRSVTPIADLPERRRAFESQHGAWPVIYNFDLVNYNPTRTALKAEKPDCIVHLAEMPSAPFSMIDARHACLTHRNNLEGTLNILWAMKEVCPEAHLLKLGTMGEWGTPNVDIPEGYFELEFRGRKDWVMFPRKAGSFYHQTKVHDSHNIEFACRTWGLRSTDIMQGVVFGTRIPEMGDNQKLLTRYDIDECFGTFINRACAAAIIGHPITVYGTGQQQRGFLPLKDSMQCLTLAIENPPKTGEYRVFNQFEDTYNLTGLAELIQRAAAKLGLPVQINNYENPRSEAEAHYYNPDRVKLLELGYQPTRDTEGEVTTMLSDLIQYEDTIRKLRYLIIPKVRWGGEKRPCGLLKRAQS
jgi:UDP-sulfoquinovose synthase